jgi:hypothetical protein
MNLRTLSFAPLLCLGAADPQMAETKQRLHTEPERWMKSQHDPGASLGTPEARDLLKATPFPKE